MLQLLKLNWKLWCSAITTIQVHLRQQRMNLFLQHLLLKINIERRLLIDGWQNNSHQRSMCTEFRLNSWKTHRVERAELLCIICWDLFTMDCTNSTLPCIYLKLTTINNYFPYKMVLRVRRKRDNSRT